MAKMIQKRKTKRNKRRKNKHVSVPVYEVQHSGKGKAKGKTKGQKGKRKDPFPTDWANIKGKHNTKSNTKKGQKGKAIPQKRQASLNLKPMKANGLNLPISHLL